MTETENIGNAKDNNNVLNNNLPIYETCPYCNRKFFEGRLSLHLKSCT